MNEHEHTNEHATEHAISKEEAREMARMTRRLEVLRVAGEFASALGLSGNDFTTALASTHDALVVVLPRGSKMRTVPVLAEIAVHHVIKTRGIAYNVAAFNTRAPTGLLPMSKRHWLLRYTMYLGPKERLALLAAQGVDPVLYLDGLAGKAPAVHVNAMALLHACKGVLARLSPRFQAGVAVAAAYKGLFRSSPRDVDGWSMARLLAEGGLPLPSSVVNAAKRVDFQALVDVVAPPGACRDGEGVTA